MARTVALIRTRGGVGELMRELLAVALLGSAAELELKLDDDGHQKWLPQGNTSEVPLVVAAAKAGACSDGVAALPCSESH